MDRRSGKIKGILINLYHKKKLPLVGIKEICDEFFSSTLVEHKIPLISLAHSSKTELLKILSEREDILFEAGFKDAEEAKRFFNRPTISKKAFFAILELINRYVRIEPRFSEIQWLCYRIWIRSFDSVLQFASEIGFSDPEKSKKLKAMLKIFRESKGKRIGHGELSQVVQAEIDDSHE